ncbi:chemotaxis protein CheA [Acidithiobacillus sp. VAN18-1]|uniref:Chemotaxis protein CheA n=1 Tax=Igneacidithiobacillus copahuensis TaxID=2724909 RepID=A0AAE2YNF8_9PROT|nr:chemotaxis protein CheA [Igneacidithiobacillus copahuensis]MBU2787424.1 chemotaxis protein CheA [Igneacidithiobacillus copahuensis]MBU2797443.1 chemotaxis protein CheA [Acidithiobacillus sp. VAN18-2]
MDMDILQDYLAEARELLEKAQEEILCLEDRPEDDELLASLFRAFHTLKGGAGFLEAQNLVDWTHHLEDLLDKLRSHQLCVSSDMIDAILRGLDVIDGMLQELAQGDEPAAGPEDLGTRIRDLAAGVATPQSSPPPEAPQQVASAAAEPTPSGTLYAEQRVDEQGKSGVYVAQHNENSDTPETTAGDEISEDEFEAVLDQLYGAQAPGMDAPESAADEISESEFEAALDQLYGLGGAPGLPAADTQQNHPATRMHDVPIAAAASPAPSAAPAATAGEPPKPKAAPRTVTSAASEVENTLRVDAARLDAVMNQVGELVLLRNRLSSAISSLLDENEDLGRIAREMDLSVNDLQVNAMRLRMQPCKRIFQQLPRVVRDASRQLGKNVQLEIIGEEVEIDKAVVDALSGPMTHLIRNSLDHGIETPEQRRALHKPETATIRVAAIHLGDRVRIEVSDDGRGIDRQIVLQKAIAKGVVSSEQAARLSEQEALELIFRPGFSTKEQATELSGRGVGMDVVKETVHKLRGQLDIRTNLGAGTTISMEFPLTLAILPVLYLRLRRETYALPVNAIESLVEIQETRIHRMQGRSVYRVDDGEVTPMIDLGELLHGRKLRLGREPIEGIQTERGLLLISEVLGNEDSVVKPLDFLDKENWYQGATISGRGNVVLILDAQALSRHGIERMGAAR